MRTGGLDRVLIIPWETLRVINVQDSATCGKCGGNCCKHFAGAAWPEQLGAPDKDKLHVELKARLLSGNWALDTWEGHPFPYEDAYFLRPAHKNKRGSFVDESWGGECVFLTHAKGCLLKHADRPAQCRALVPNAAEPGECEAQAPLSGNGKLDAARAWEPYRDVVQAVLMELRVEID